MSEAMSGATSAWSRSNPKCRWEASRSRQSSVGEWDGVELKKLKIKKVETWCFAQIIFFEKWHLFFLSSLGSSGRLMPAPQATKGTSVSWAMPGTGISLSLKNIFFSQRYSNWIREKTRDVSQTWQVQKGEGKNSTNSNSVRYCYEIIRETGSENTPKSFGTRISHQCVQTLWFCAKVAHFDLLLRIDFWVLSNEQENQKVAHLSLFKILCSKIKFLF